MPVTHMEIIKALQRHLEINFSMLPFVDTICPSLILTACLISNVFNNLYLIYEQINGHRVIFYLYNIP
jgi:hypothetical protein